MPDEWLVWESWMTRAARSTGFAPPDSGDPPPVTLFALVLLLLVIGSRALAGGATPGRAVD